MRGRREGVIKVEGGLEGVLDNFYLCNNWVFSIFNFIFLY